MKKTGGIIRTVSPTENAIYLFLFFTTASAGATMPGKYGRFQWIETSVYYKRIIKGNHKRHLRIMTAPNEQTSVLCAATTSWCSTSLRCIRREFFFFFSCRKEFTMGVGVCDEQGATMLGLRVFDFSIMIYGNLHEGLARTGDVAEGEGML